MGFMVDIQLPIPNLTRFIGLTYDNGDNPIYGGFSNNGTAEHNIVNITGGLIRSGVYGGYSTSNSEFNEINISGGTISIKTSYLWRFF